MMKTVLLVIGAFLLAFDSSAQERKDEYIMWPTDANTEKIIFTESVFAPSQDASGLYANAKKFATLTFKGERDTIIENDTNKTITCRGSFVIPVEELGDRGKGYIAFTLFVWCHKNVYKYSLTDLEHFPLNSNCVTGGPLENEKATSSPMLFPRKYWNNEKAKCYYRVQTTIEQFKEAMSRQAES